MATSFDPGNHYLSPRVQRDSFSKTSRVDSLKIVTKKVTSSMLNNLVKFQPDNMDNFNPLTNQFFQKHDSLEIIAFELATNSVYFVMKSKYSGYRGGFQFEIRAQIFTYLKKLCVKRASLNFFKCPKFPLKKTKFFRFFQRIVTNY